MKLVDAGETESGNRDEEMEEESSRVVVCEGDTLWGLSEKFGVQWEHIQATNNLKDDVIYAGELLKVPKKPTKAWVVQPGDSAWEISERFGLTIEELRDLNKTIPDVLYPGDVLLVPEAACLRPRRVWNFKAVKARLNGLAADANAKFFDVFPYPQGISSVSYSTKI